MPVTEPTRQSTRPNKGVPPERLGWEDDGQAAQAGGGLAAQAGTSATRPPNQTRPPFSLASFPVTPTRLPLSYSTSPRLPAPRLPFSPPRQGGPVRPSLTTTPVRPACGPGRLAFSPGSPDLFQTDEESSDERPPDLADSDPSDDESADEADESDSDDEWLPASNHVQQVGAVPVVQGDGVGVAVRAD